MARTTVKRRSRKHAPGKCPDLPVEPFIEWLRTLGPNSKVIAEECGLFQRAVYGYLHGERAVVAMDTVDRACIHAGAHIDDIYPLEEAA